MAVVTEQDGGRALLLETRVARVFFYASSGNKIYCCIYSRPNISAFLFHSRDMFSAFSESLTFTRSRAFVFDASVWKLYSIVPSRVSPLILRINLVLTYGIPPAFRGGVYLFIPPTAIESVPSFIRSHDCVPMVFTTDSLQAQGH